MSQRLAYLDGASDLPPVQDLRYISPTASGIAYNGKYVATLAETSANLNRTGAIWNVGPNGQITYTFLDKDPTGLYNSPKYQFLADTTAEFSSFSPEQRAAARDSLQLWDDLIAPHFVEKNGRGAADISFMNTGEGGPGQAAAYTPFYAGEHGKEQKIQGNVFVDANQADNFDLGYGGYGQTTLTHEIGHTLGLSHIGDYDAAVGSPNYAHDAYYFQDSYQYSIMSYFSSANTGAVGYVNWATGGYYQTPQTPMVDDIAAVQKMYGADLTTRTGNETYGFNNTSGRAVFDFTQNKNPFLTIYDAGGHDTLDLSGFTGGKIVLDLRDGAFSTGYNYGNAAEIDAALHLNPALYTQAFWNAVYDGNTGNPAFLTENIGIAYGTIIEDGKTGAGNDTLRGNAVANVLDGGAGNDTYTGDLGADTFVIKNLGGLDRITDFSHAQGDKIDLTGIDAIAGGSDNAFTLVNGAFTGAGQIHLYTDAGVNYLSGDVNGDGVADFVIHLGTATVTAGDILL